MFICALKQKKKETTINLAGIQIFPIDTIRQKIKGRNVLPLIDVYEASIYSIFQSLHLDINKKINKDRLCIKSN